MKKAMGKKHVMVKLAAVLFAVFAITVTASEQTPDTRWYSNTEADTFWISTAEELAGLAQIVNDIDNGYDFSGKTVVLVNDIDLSDWGVWTPIGGSGNPFSGVFDGNGKTIKGIYINNNNQSRVGLFGYVAQNGVVKDVGVVDAYISGYLYVGGVVGRLAGGTVTGCYSTGVMHGADVGGVVGQIEESGSLTNCYSSANVSDTRSGGVVGTNKGGKVTNCYSTGNVIGGGVVGFVFDGGVVTNCYSTGTVRNDESVGGVVGTVHIRGGSKVTGCAALNPGITAIPSRGRTYIGRVVGAFFDDNNDYVYENHNMSDNVAFNAMGITNSDFPNIFPNVNGANTVNGVNIGIEEILAADSTLDKLFTKENGWTTEKGKLPGLLGKAVDIPEHLYRETAAILAENREIPVSGGSGAGVAVVAPAVSANAPAGELSVGPNPVDKQSGEVNFFYQGKRVKSGALAVYDASGNFVKKIGVTGKPAENAVKPIVASWDLRDKKGCPVTNGTYLVRGTIATADGKKTPVSVVVGVR